ncbi:TonB-dependent receptor [Novosphingobium olei]|uniref:TonB-dependent receptor n=1 Tax=Novosphingobium olei TaxID=2728851 RepID=A0A7Y0BU13_9SPHN|nr:TonB-dependent receptor [Novosphingobium olei]NML96265.1 TonB-dependent receptor [Novosphingobium olei]
MKGILRAGTAGVILAAMIATPAFAQEAQADSNDSGGLAEIVVTAQRRSENLQNVPIAITAATADTLAQARVDNVSNIQAITPSVTFRTANISSSTANVIIRGLGTTGNSRSFEGSVGVFIDGVYRTRAAAALQNFLDIDNLQVLRGPQGTLFGKNTTAGALLLASAKPSTDKSAFLFDATYGNYNSLMVKAAGNVPLSDTVAFRIAGLASTREGFYTNPTTGKDLNGDATQAVKAQLLFEPSSDFSVRLIGDYSRGSGNCCYATSEFAVGPTTGLLIEPLTAANGGVVSSRDPSAWEQTLNGNGNQVIKDYGATLQMELALGGGTLKSVSAYRKFEVNQNDMDPDFTGADLFRYYENFKSRFLSQELTYNGKIEALNADFVLGGFISDEKLQMGRTLPWASQAQVYWDALLGGPLAGINGYLASQGLDPVSISAPVGTWAVEKMRGKARSYAGFAHVDFAVGEKVNVIAGLRYSVEKKQGSFVNPYYRTSPNGSATEIFTLLGLMPSPAYDREITNKSLSGTFGIQYRPVSDVMLYATYNRGFKAGGVNIDANAAGTVLNNGAFYSTLSPSQQIAISLLNGGAGVSPPTNPTYKPETVNAFEVGAKIQYLNRRARTNIALFYYDLHDLQVAQFLGLQFTVLNTAKAKDYGLEIENLFELTDGVTLALDGTWVPHAKYGKDPLLDPALSGQRFRYAPKFAGNATINVDTPITENVNLTARLQYQYTGKQFVNTAGTEVQGAVSLVNANLGFKLPKSGLTVEGWVQNLFDETYFTAAFNSTLQTGDIRGYLGAPRTYGIRLRAAF